MTRASPAGGRSPFDDAGFAHGTAREVAFILLGTTTTAPIVTFPSPVRSDPPRKG